MLGDLKALVSIPGEQLDQIASALASAKGFLDTKALNALLRQKLQSTAAVDAVRRVVLNIEAEKIAGFLATIRRLKEESDADEFPLADHDIESLEALLPRLLKPVPALRRFRKAERLAKITGQPLEDIQLICDLRPIFDEARKTIEGLMPYTTLRVVATGGDGLPRTFEAELSAQDVADLREKATKAADKLTTLREKAEEWAAQGVPEVGGQSRDDQDGAATARAGHRRGASAAGGDDR